MSRALLYLPLALFAALAAYLALGLRGGEPDPSAALLNRAMPAFALPAISDAHEPLRRDAIIGAPALVNIFASWCVPCAIEHPVLMRIAEKEGVPIYGINWKERPGEGAAWLARLGDPYRAVGDDRDGRVAIDFGITGAPETFLIDARGVIRYRHVGPLTEELWARDVKPVYEALRAEGA